MDIVLRTNDPEAGLELRGFHRFADGSGFRTLVCIRSGEFSAQVPYYFEPHPFNRFIGELEALDRSLSG